MLSSMNASSLPARPSSRSGPVPPVVPASASAWQPPQPWAVEDGLAVLRAALAARRRRLRSPPLLAAARGLLRALLQPGVELAAARRRARSGASRRGRGRTAPRRRPGSRRARVGVTRSSVSIPRTASIFMRKAGTQKSWMTSLDWTVKWTCWPTRHVELRRGDLLAAVRVLVEEGPGELLADDADLERRVGRRLLDVRQHDVGVGAERDEQDRRDRGPDDLEPRVAVDRRAVEVLLARAACGSARRSRGRPS